MLLFVAVLFAISIFFLFQGAKIKKGAYHTSMLAHLCTSPQNQKIIVRYLFVIALCSFLSGGFMAINCLVKYVFLHEPFLWLNLLALAIYPIGFVIGLVQIYRLGKTE